MSEEFAVSLRSFLDRSKMRAIDLERAASLPNATVAKLLQGQRPSVERLGEILNAVPRQDGSLLLRAYLGDAIPPDWKSSVTITIGSATISPAPVRDKLAGALEHLRAAAISDVSFYKWVIHTASLYGFDETDPHNERENVTRLPQPDLYAPFANPEPDPAARVADVPDLSGNTGC